MIKYIRRSIFVLFCLFASLCSVAQSSSAPRMDSLMEQNGKIYVVVAVLVVIFIGIILFLLRMERRLNKLEKRDHLPS